MSLGTTGARASSYERALGGDIVGSGSVMAMAFIHQDPFSVANGRLHLLGEQRSYESDTYRLLWPAQHEEQAHEQYQTN